MAWMKLDDNFHASRKLNSIPKRHRFQAAGLWAIAGSWVAGQGTDGFVPNYMIEVWGPTDKTVESLVNAGLWNVESGGFSFDSWLEYNPSKAQTEAERAASAERMRKSRERRRAERAGQESGGEDVAPQQSEVLQRNTPDVLQRPDPTRPDPTHINKGGGDLTVPRAHAREPLPTQIPESWIADPRAARCSTHILETTPPACGQCGDARRAAERERDRQAQHQADDHRRRRTAIANCQLCDEAGWVHGSDPLVRCRHDAEVNRSTLAAVEAEKLERERAEAEARRESAEAPARQQLQGLVEQMRKRKLARDSEEFQEQAAAESEQRKQRVTGFGEAANF